jgi:hypothetical protein
MKIVEVDGKEIVVLSQGNNPNFNRPENQWQCVKVGWPKSWKKEKDSIHIILQWFIHVRNYGCINLRGEIINLNIDKDRKELMELFIEEGFCRRITDHRYDGATLIETLDPEYSFILPTEEHQFWVNALVYFLEELNDEEIKEYNRTHQQITVEKIL